MEYYNEDDQYYEEEDQYRKPPKYKLDVEGKGQMKSLQERGPKKQKKQQQQNYEETEEMPQYDAH